MSDAQRYNITGGPDAWNLIRDLFRKCNDPGELRFLSSEFVEEYEPDDRKYAPPNLMQERWGIPQQKRNPSVNCHIYQLTRLGDHSGQSFHSRPDKLPRFAFRGEISWLSGMASAKVKGEYCSDSRKGWFELVSEPEIFPM